MKTPKASQYIYTVVDISEDGEVAYQAIVPKFPKMLIFDDDPKRLHKVTQIFIEEEIEDCKKAGIPIPPPDRGKNYSGKFIVRIHPELHENLAMLSLASGKTLNQYIKEILSKEVAYSEPAAE